MGARAPRSAGGIAAGGGGDGRRSGRRPRLHDTQQAAIQGDQRDDELGDVAERGVQQPAERLARVHRQLLGHKREALRKRRDRDERAAEGHRRVVPVHVGVVVVRRERRREHANVEPRLEEERLDAPRPVDGPALREDVEVLLDDHLRLVAVLGLTEASELELRRHPNCAKGTREIARRDRRRRRRGAAKTDDSSTSRVRRTSSRSPGLALPASPAPALSLLLSELRDARSLLGPLHSHRCAASPSPPTTRAMSQLQRLGR